MTDISAASVEEPESKSVTYVICEKLVSGTCGGIAMAVTTQPLDRVKALIQQGDYKTIGGAFSSIYREAGIRGMYKGIWPPLCISGIFNGALFFCNELAKRLIAKFCSVDPHELWVVTLAAILAAPPTIAILNPADRIKVQQQLDHKSGAQSLSVRQCARRILQTEGVRGLLLTGYEWSLLREVIGSPFYFAGYHASKKAFRAQFPEHKSDFQASALCGAFAGVCYWIPAAPTDTVRTKVMGQVGEKALTGMQISRQIMQRSGIGGFYVGFSACILRAAPANAACFSGISLAESWMDRVIAGRK